MKTTLDTDGGADTVNVTTTGTQSIFLLSTEEDGDTVSIATTEERGAVGSATAPPPPLPWRATARRRRVLDMFRTALTGRRPAWSLTVDECPDPSQGIANGAQVFDVAVIGCIYFSATAMFLSWSPFASRREFEGRAGA